MENRDDMSGLELLRRLADDLDDSRAWWLVKESRQRFWGCGDFSEVSLRDLLMELYGKLRGETGGAEGSRLMPEGMEWPRFEGGEPVRIGDEAADSDGRELDEPVVSIELFENGFALHGDALQAFYGYEERVKRPAPKVLDADGVDIRVGDTVYGFSGQEYEVTGLCELDPIIVHAKTVFDGVAADELLALSGHTNSAQLDSSKLTHQRPVLAADGLPLRVGETVYHLADGRAAFVREVLEGGAVIEQEDGRPIGQCRADYLTHERPDSLGRLADDLEEMRAAWCSHPGLHGDQKVAAAIVGDESLGKALEKLVRRARALAGRDAK